MEPLQSTIGQGQRDVGVFSRARALEIASFIEGVFLARAVP